MTRGTGVQGGGIDSAWSAQRKGQTWLGVRPHVAFSSGDSDTLIFPSLGHFAGDPPSLCWWKLGGHLQGPGTWAGGSLTVAGHFIVQRGKDRCPLLGWSLSGSLILLESEVS